MAETTEKPQVTVTARETEDDPPITVYHVEIIHRGGSWDATYGSRELLNAFLYGVHAGCMMLGVHVPDPVIPRPE